jgi:hypothetical protein
MSSRQKIIYDNNNQTDIQINQTIRNVNIKDFVPDVSNISSILFRIDLFLEKHEMDLTEIVGTNILEQLFDSNSNFIKLFRHFRVSFFN